MCRFHVSFGITLITIYTIYILVSLWRVKSVQFCCRPICMDEHILIGTTLGLVISRSSPEAIFFCCCRRCCCFCFLLFPLSFYSNTNFNCFRSYQLFFPLLLMLDESEKIRVHLNVKRNDRPGTPFVLVLMIYKLNKSNTMLYTQLVTIQ